MDETIAWEEGDPSPRNLKTKTDEYNFNENDLSEDGTCGRLTGRKLYSSKRRRVNLSGCRITYSARRKHVPAISAMNKSANGSVNRSIFSRSYLANIKRKNKDLAVHYSKIKQELTECQSQLIQLNSVILGYRQREKQKYLEVYSRMNEFVKTCLEDVSGFSWNEIAGAGVYMEDEEDADESPKVRRQRPQPIAETDEKSDCAEDMSEDEDNPEEDDRHRPRSMSRSLRNTLIYRPSDEAKNNSDDIDVSIGDAPPREPTAAPHQLVAGCRLAGDTGSKDSPHPANQTNLGEVDMELTTVSPALLLPSKVDVLEADKPKRRSCAPRMSIMRAAEGKEPKGRESGLKNFFRKSVRFSIDRSGIPEPVRPGGESKEAVNGMEERWEPQVAPAKKPETPPSAVSMATELSLDVSSEEDFEEEEQLDSDEEAETPVNEEEEEEKVAALLLSYRKTVTSSGGSSTKQKFDPEMDYASLLAKASRVPARGAGDIVEKENQGRRPPPAATEKAARPKTSSPKAVPLALANISDRLINCVPDETQRKQAKRDTFCVRKEEPAPECAPAKDATVEVDVPPPRRQTISVRPTAPCSPIAETGSSRDTQSSMGVTSRESSFDELDESNAKRPRRGRMVSYKEPPLNRKLRKGDPHTDSFTSKYSPTKPIPKKAPPRRVR